MKIWFALAGACWAMSALAQAQTREDPARDLWQKPQDVVMALELQASETIAAIGDGAGYFSGRLARHARKVYTVDGDSNLLAMLRKDAPANLETILGAPDDPKLPAGAVDTIFMCDSLRQIADRTAFYPKVARALKPGGRVVVLEFYKRILPVGPPPSIKLSEEQVIGEFDQAGFRLAKRLSFLPYQYYLFFEKR